MILVTGVTGHLGHLIVEGLLAKGVGSSELAGLARTPAKAAALTANGVAVRQGDYSVAASLAPALAGVEQLMFVSSSELGARAPGHLSLIAAAKQAGVKHIVYTSILNADSSPMELAADHLVTEAALRQSGVPFTFLRNGWYFENYTENLGAPLAHGVLLGAAQEGRFALASRQDFAEAAVAVLTSKADQAGKIYELGGKPTVSMSELAAEIAKQAGKPVQYVNLPPAEYEKKLESFGLPAFVAHLLADSDSAAARGFLDTTANDLEQLIGRPTTSLAAAVKAGLAKAG